MAAAKSAEKIMVLIFVFFFEKRLETRYRDSKNSFTSQENHDVEKYFFWQKKA